MMKRQQYAVFNYKGTMIGRPTLNLGEAEVTRKRNQMIADSIGEGYYNYHIRERDIIVGEWRDCDA